MSAPLLDASALFASESYADVLFILRGDERLHAHRLVLALRSRYFEKLFKASSGPLREYISLCGAI